MHLPILLGGDTIFFLKQGIEVRAICEPQLCGDGTDGFIGFCQVVRRLFHAEGQTIIIETHISEFVDNTV